MPNCYVHPRQEAAHACTDCGRDVCRSCTMMVEGEPICELCLQRYIVQEQPAEPSPEEQTVPWLRINELGPVHAFFQTATELVLSPRSFYQRIGPASSWGAAVLFAVICTMLIWYPVYVIHITVLVPAILNALAEQDELTEATTQSLAEAQAESAAVTELSILVAPIQHFILYILVASVIQQWMIMALKGKQGLAVTMQVRCYAMTVQCLAVIPFLGFILAEVANMMVCAYGFKEAQRLPLAQAFLVAAIPVLILVVLGRFS